MKQIYLLAILLATWSVHAKPQRLEVQQALRHVSNATVLVTMDTGILEQHAPGLIFARADNRAYVVTDAAVVQAPKDQGIYRLWARFNDAGMVKADLIDDQFMDGLALLEIPFRHPHLPLEQSTRHTREDIVTGYMWGYSLGDRAVRRLLAKGTTMPPSWVIADFKPVRGIDEQLDSFGVAYRPVAGEVDGTPGTVAVDRFGDVIGIVSAIDEADNSLRITPIQHVRASLKGMVQELAFAPVRGRRGYFQVSGKTVDPTRRIGAIILASKRWDRDQAMPREQADGFWARAAHDMREQRLTLRDGKISGEIRLRPDQAADESHIIQAKLLYSDREAAYCRPQIVNVWGEEPDVSKWFAPDFDENRPLEPSDIRPGEVKEISKVRLDGRNVVLPLMWSADDRKLLMLHRNGLLEERSLPSLEVTRSLDLDRRAVDMARTKLGLAVLLENDSVWVVNEQTFQVTRKVQVPGARALEGNQDSYTMLLLGPRKDRLYTVSLAGIKTQTYRAREVWLSQKQWARRHPAAADRTLAEFSEITLAPDGEQLIVRSNQCLHRFVFRNSKLAYQEMGPPIGEEPGRIIFTRDSTHFGFVNVSDQLLPAHPPIRQGSYVYHVHHIQMPVISLNYGARPRAVGFNEGIIYSQNMKQGLIRYAPRIGVRDGYRFDITGRTLDILPVPSKDVEQLVLLSERDLIWISF